MFEIRISLQDKLTKQVDTAITATAIKDVMAGIDQLISFENLYVAVTILELVTGEEILPGTPNDIYYIIDALRDFDPSKILRWFVAEGFDIADIFKDAAWAIANPFKDFDRTGA